MMRLPPTFDQLKSGRQERKMVNQNWEDMHDPTNSPVDVNQNQDDLGQAGQRKVAFGPISSVCGCVLQLKNSGFQKLPG